MKAKRIFTGAALVLLYATFAYATDPPLSGNAGVNFAVSQITIGSSRPVVISLRNVTIAQEPGNEASLDLWVDGKNVLNHSAKMAYDEQDYVLQGPGSFKVTLRCSCYKAQPSSCTIKVKDADGTISVK